MVDYGGAVLPLTVDDSALKRSLAGTLGSFKAFGSQVDGVMANLGRFTIAATGLYALKKAFDATTGAALSFNQQLKATWAVAGDLSRGELRALGGEVRSLARQFNMTATEAQHAMYEINQSVFYGADALVILKESAKGAAAGMTDVYTVADMMTTVLNAYGMAATESAHVNDVLFQTVLYGKVTMNELASEFGRLAGVAAPVGASLEEVSAAIATLTRLGIDTDTAVTAIRQSLFQILRPSKALKTAITALGYTTGRAMVESLGFAQSLQALVDYGNSAGVEMESLFSNIRAVLAILPLTSTAAGEYADDLLRVGNSAGAADTAFKKITSSWLYQIQNLKVILNDLAVSFGQLLVPAIQAFLKTVQMMLTPLAHVAEFLGQIGGQQTVALVTTVGALSLAFGGFVKILNAARLAVWGLIEAEGALYTAGRFLFKAPINFGMNASIPKGLGLAALGAFGLGAAIKGLTVDLPIYLDPKVTGAEKTKAKLKTALETGLGSFLGGAIFAKMLGATFGGAVAAGIGAGLFTATIGIYIAAEIIKGKQAAEEAAAALAAAFTIPKSKEEIEKERTKAAVEQINIRELLPFKIADSIREASKGWEQSSILAVVEDLIKANEYLSSFKGKERNFLVQQLYGIVDAMYETEVTVDDFGNRIRKLRTDFEDAATSPDTLSTAIDDFANQYRTLAKLTGAPAIVKDVASEIDMARYSFTRMWDQLKAGNLTGEEATKKWEEINAVVDYWADKAEIAEAAGWKSAAAIRAFSDELNAFVEVADATWAKQIDALVKAWQDTTAPIEKRIAAGESLQSLRKSLAELATNPVYAQFKQSLLDLVKRIDAAGLSMGDAAQSLTVGWESLREGLLSGQLTVEQFFQSLLDLALRTGDLDASLQWLYDKAKDLSEELGRTITLEEVFQIELGVSADVAAELSRRLDEAADSASDFATQMRNAGAGIASMIGDLNSLMDQALASMAKAETVGEWGDLYGQFESIVGEGQSQRERYERMFVNPDPGFMAWVNETPARQAEYEAARDAARAAATEWQQLPGTIGQTNADVAAEQERLAEEAARAAREAASAAAQAAQDAAQAASDAADAMQEAFRDQFLNPVKKAMESGDWFASAETIRAMANAREQYVKMAQSLSDANGEHIDEAEVLELLIQSYSELLSALDNEIKWMQIAGEDATELEKLKTQIENLFDPLGGLKNKIEEILGIKNPLPGATSASFRKILDAMYSNGYDSGGLVPGSGSGDIVPAMLEPGEFVIPRWMMAIPGIGGLIRRVWTRGKRMQSGGCVGGVCPVPWDIDVNTPTAPTVDLAPALNNVAAAANRAAASVSAMTSSCNSCQKAQQQAAQSATDYSKEVTVAVEAVKTDWEALLQRNLADAEPGSGGWDLAYSSAKDFIAAIEQLISEFDYLGYDTTKLREHLAAEEAELRKIPEALIAFRNNLERYGTDIKDFILAVFPEDMASTINAFFSAMQEVASINPAHIKQGLTFLKSGLTDIGLAIVGMFRGVSGEQTQAGFAAGGASVLSGIGSLLTGNVLGVVTSVIGVFSAIGDYVKKKREEMKKKIQQMLEVAWDAARWIATAAYKTGRLIVTVLGKIVSVFGWVAEKVANAASAVISMLGDAVGGAYGAVGKGISSAFQRLVEVSTTLADRFRSLITSIDAYTEIQSALSELQKSIFSALFSFLSPIATILKKIVGLYEDEAEALGTSLNVPTGYKVTAAEWKAATPGEPGIKKGAEEEETWIEKLLTKFKDAIEAAIAPFKKFFDLMAEIAEIVGPAILQGLLPALGNFGNALVELANQIKSELVPLLTKHLPGIIEGAFDFFFDALLAAANGLVIVLKGTLPEIEKALLALGKFGDTLIVFTAEIAKAVTPTLAAFVAGIATLIDRISVELMPVLTKYLPAALNEVAKLTSTVLLSAWNTLLNIVLAVIPQLQGFGAEIGKLSLSVPKLFAEIGNAITPIIVAAVGAFTELLKRINTELIPALSGKLAPAITGIATLLSGAFFGAVNSVLTVLVGVIPNLSAFGASLGTIGKQLPELFSAIAAKITPSVQALIDSFTALSGRISKELIPALITNLPTILANFLTIIKGLFDGISNSVVTALTKLLPSLTALSTSLVKLSATFEPLITKITDQLVPVLEYWIGEITKLVDSITTDLMPVIQDTLPAILEGAANLLGGSITGIGKLISDTFKNTLPGLSTLFTTLGETGKQLPGLFSSLATALSPVINTVTYALNGLGQWINKTLLPDLQTFFGNFSKWWQAEADPFLKEKVFPKLSEWGNQLYTFFKEKVLPFLQNKVWPFFENKLWPLIEKFGDKLITVLTKLFDVIDKHWPIIEEWLANKLEKWLDGLLQNINKLTGAIGLLEGPFGWLKTAFKNFCDWLTNLFGGSKVTNALPVALQDAVKQVQEQSSSSSGSGTVSGKKYETIDTTSDSGTTAGSSAAKDPDVWAISTPGSFSTSSKWNGKTLYEWLAGIGIGTDLANKIAGAWHSIGKGDALLAWLVQYEVGSKSALKSLFAAGHPAGITSSDYSWAPFSIPGLKKGGFTLSEGLAYLHKHEYVLPAKTASLAAAGISGNIVVESYTILDGKIVAEAVNKVNASRETRATGGPGGRRWSRWG